MRWFNKKKKCKVCLTKQLKADNEIRINTSDGPHVIYPVCDKCSDFFDKSAEVLTRKNENDSI